MSLYRCTIATDGDRRQIIVHWDDNDPNRHIVAPITVEASDLDEERLAHELGRSGFRIASTGSDNIGRGWAIVSHTRTDWPYFNPVDGGWYSFLSETVKHTIAETWPTASVPGASKR